MSHHISTRFVGAFAKIHITRVNIFAKNSKNAPGERILLLYSAPRQFGQNHSFPHTRYLGFIFLFKIVG